MGKNSHNICNLLEIITNKNPRNFHEFRDLIINKAKVSEICPSNKKIFHLGLCLNLSKDGSVDDNTDFSKVLGVTHTSNKTSLFNTTSVTFNNELIASKNPTSSRIIKPGLDCKVGEPLIQNYKHGMVPSKVY